MKNTKCCHKQNCDSQDFSTWLYDGKLLCKEHYNERFLEDLKNQFTNWDGTSEPSSRLKYLIGRYYAENEIAYLGKPSLTKAIVHQQSYDWKKIGDTVIFTAIRYPVNKKYGEPFFDEVHQTWKFNVKKLTFKFQSEKMVA